MKNLKVPTIFLFVLLVFFSKISAVQASPASRLPKDHHVLEAVSLMYAPMSDNRSGWLDAVCQGMTEGGCAYFTDQLESGLWQSGQNVVFNSIGNWEVVATLEDGSQVWKGEISICKTCSRDLKDCPLIESDIFLHVVYDEAQKEWRLNRVLYGPYISEL